MEDGYFRPMRLATIKLVSDLANGHYVLGYRLFHALLVLAFLVLFVRALEVRDRLALAVVPLALTVFVGIHTFLGTVKEIYPTNHFLQIAVLALLALNLAQSRGGLLVDVLLFVTFTVAALTLESGLIVWVVVVAAWMSGMPGVSRRSVAGVTALLAGTSCCDSGFSAPVCRRSRNAAPDSCWRRSTRRRFASGSATTCCRSTPTTSPRPSPPCCFRSRGRACGCSSAPFAAISSRRATSSRSAHRSSPPGCCWHTSWRELRSGVRRPATLADQHTVIFALVLAANAAMSYVYTKDEIMSTAGAFYALAVAGAAVYFLRTWPERARSGQATAVVCVVCLAGSAAWAIRAAGVHHVLRSQAFVQRNDWTRLDRDMEPRRQLGALSRAGAARPRAAARGDLDARGQSPLRAALDGTCLRHLLLTGRLSRPLV